ncbi:Oxysterol binding protein [Entamoeba marina]
MSSIQTTPCSRETDAIKALNASVYCDQPQRSQEYMDAMEKGMERMSLERVTLPTHVMEPRSLLEKLTDYFTHVQLANEAANALSPELRMLKIVRFFLSGFYITPSACKKPYNPLLGEFYRTQWEHPDGSNTFFVAEQTSHHPPVTSLYVCNRKAGWVGTGSLDFVTTFHGLSASAGIQGQIKAKLTKFDEEYVWNFPMALVTGIFVGPLKMEIGGVLNFSCKKTGYSAKVEFKTMSMFSSSNYKQIQGTISGPNGVIYEISGNYGEELFILNKRNGVKKSFIKIDEIRNKRDPRLVVDFDKLHPFESEKLWKNVGDAIIAGDQNRAMEEKYVLEENQRAQRRLVVANKTEHVRRLFHLNDKKEWIYNWENWDKYEPEKDGEELEIGGKLITLKKDEVLTEERIQELTKDLAYAPWGEEEPPHIMEKFRFLLERYKSDKDTKNDLNEAKKVED